MTKILLVEDDDATADYVANGLKEQGFVVDRAANGRDGLFRFLGNGKSEHSLVIKKLAPGGGVLVDGAKL